MIPREKFEVLVEKAINSLPISFRKKLKNLSFMIETWPPKTEDNKIILGFYHGVPFPHRGPFYGNVTPDLIVIYQGPIEALCNSEEEVEEKVKEVVLHEIGHYFGLSEAALNRIEKEGKSEKKKKNKSPLIK
ncbi:MAG: metallopeptidase family protein [Candidatus Aminicenantes bacterium]|nr:metallopeptidase family protein [Candidatus Aminicenantes bacterium]